MTARITHNGTGDRQAEVQAGKPSGLRSCEGATETFPEPRKSIAHIPRDVLYLEMDPKVSAHFMYV